MSDETNQLNTAAASASITLDDLAAAAKRADSAFDNKFMNIRSITDGLNALGGVMSGLAKAFGVFEARFQALNRMTDYGANFGYSIKAMDDAANATRLTLSQLAGIVKENSENLAMFGTGVEGGMQTFLKSIQSFQQQTDGFGRTFETSARLLGYSFDQLNEGIQDYSQISAFSRSKERYDADLRNQSMADYLETVDELAQLTGKQRDAVSDSITAEARKGQTIIRAGQLGDRGDEYAEFVGLMNTEFKGPLGDLSSDILTAGFGLTDETRRMQGLFAPFANSLEELRRAYEDPTKTDAQIKALEDNVRAQAAGSMDLSVMELGVYSSLNSVSSTIAGVAESLGPTSARVNQYRDLIESQTGEQLSSAEAFTRIQGEIRDRQTKALTLADEGTPERARQDFITNTIKFEQSAANIRKTATDLAYANLATTMNNLSNLFTQMTTGLADKMSDTLKVFDYSLSEALAAGQSVKIAQSIQEAQDIARGLGDNEATTLLTKLEEQILRFQPGNTAQQNDAIVAEIDSLVAEINQRRAQDMVVNADNVVVNERAPNNIPQGPAPDNMFGSMKAYGRLFNNYGQETLQPLHGLEAVTTPAQMADIVMNAAMGGRSALAQDIVSGITSASSSTASNSTARIDSMLNTVSSRLRDVVTTVAQDNNTSPDTVINEFMNQLPKTLKTALEEAMGSSLRPSLEQLVSIGAQHAETSNKIRKGFSGISNDYMRS